MGGELWRWPFVTYKVPNDGGPKRLEEIGPTIDLSAL